MSWTTKGHAFASRHTLTPAFWKIISAVLLLCLIAQQYILHDTAKGPVEQKLPFFEHVDEPELPSPPHALDPDRNLSSLVTEPHIPLAVPDLWTYEWRRDSVNHGLTEAQCDAAFPDLYSEIDRSRAYWSRREISTRDIDLDVFPGNDGGVRLLIADSQLRIIQTRGLYREDFRHRIIAVVQQVLRAITAAESSNEDLPDAEFTVIVDDIPVLDDEHDPAHTGAMWAFTRSFANDKHDSLWLVPDFHFFGAPPAAEAFRTMQTRFRRFDAPLTKKIPKLVWRGAEWTNPEVRRPLIEATAGKKWADVKVIDWQDESTIMPMEAFCRYRYTVNTEGRAWSARMTHLLNCDSLLVVHDVDWIAHYYHLLDTGLNCIHANRNFSDLEETIEYYNAHLDEAQQIADTARRTFRERYTSPAATACYWRKLLRTWADVSFSPVVTEPTPKKHSMAAKRKPRGISFEEFIVHENTKDYPYESEKPV